MLRLARGRLRGRLPRPICQPRGGGVEDLGAIDAHLDDVLAGCGDYAVWGVGELTVKLLAVPALRSRRLVALVDGNDDRHGLRFGNVAVMAPHALPPHVPVIIGSLLSGIAIRRAMTEAGLPNPVVDLTRGRRLAQF